ncbi:D-alanyl-D-alanine carboxypeptidase/D-alanyl-D-alanine-endopeptidase [Sphingomonas sp. SUN039]|uniref:D-alanyl-D-alanine carboxypeptidase/D-alanyl-D-alanine endopeptidase n=1 Tax=Sphingomonas sp. SUN039 TaxID=2937787 RepID=UPI00216411FF|nr:D-alanyl-D-alanine carboxypeptidase/D-alanyl-D-alanine-endopeptidase [Sphingomonas sp. SUN039]UVO54615.1 D-alanyl-D-alanine carboxypeptidase/D-alanyl-D-alanine-endopeptidase [Sphingomonas sp. SUN039]
MKHGFAAFALVAAPLHAAPTTLQQQVEARLAEMGPGTRFGLVVADAGGRELVAIAPTDRFIPASNTKMFTVAAALATLTDIDKPDTVGGTSVRIDKTAQGIEVVLTGRGDARMSAKPDCQIDCLATLADAVAAKVKSVWSVRGDASAFVDRRWSAGMSWNNIPTESGTAVSALTLDNNEVPFTVTPGAVGAAPIVTFGAENGTTPVPPRRGVIVLNGGPYYSIDNRALTVAAGETALEYDRLPFENVIRLTGTIAVGAASVAFRAGIDDPAFFAAQIFQRLLVARGVKVGGVTGTAYRPEASSKPKPTDAVELQTLTPPPLFDDLTIINKVSQNLHAELLLRRVGAAGGEASVAGGLKAVEAMLARAGVSRTGYDFSDGSGMSTYNRVAPRAMIAFLRWTATQPWGVKFRATLPVGGVDGTIARRFAGTPLAGKVFAKTGGLNATNALSGWMTAASGRELTFAFFANDVPQGQRAIPVIDAVLNLIAAAN